MEKMLLKSYLCSSNSKQDIISFGDLNNIMREGNHG